MMMRCTLYLLAFIIL